MIRLTSTDFKMAPALFALAIAMASFTTSANGSPLYSFQTLDNNGDTNFNQLLGIDSLASPTIVGYFGDGTNVPNSGYTLASPYGPGSYNNENYPGSAQTQVTGIAPNSSTTTVGFYIDGAGNNLGFVDVGGTFTSVSDPLTPVGTGSVNQLLGVNDNGNAVGSYVDGSGDNQSYVYNIGTKSFTPITLPGGLDATSTIATGINDAGVITGYYITGGGETYGFIDNAGTFTSYSDPSGTDTMFLGINASDEVVGSYVDGSGVTDGLLFNLGTDSFETIDDPLASSSAALLTSA